MNYYLYIPFIVYEANSEIIIQDLKLQSIINI